MSPLLGYFVIGYHIALGIVCGHVQAFILDVDAHGRVGAVLYYRKGELGVVVRGGKEELVHVAAYHKVNLALLENRQKLLLHLFEAMVLGSAVVKGQGREVAHYNVPFCPLVLFALDKCGQPCSLLGAVLVEIVEAAIYRKIIGLVLAAVEHHKHDVTIEAAPIILSVTLGYETEKFVGAIAPCLVVAPYKEEGLAAGKEFDTFIDKALKGLLGIVVIIHHVTYIKDQVGILYAGLYQEASQFVGMFVHVAKGDKGAGGGFGVEGGECVPARCPILAKTYLVGMETGYLA